MVNTLLTTATAVLSLSGSVLAVPQGWGNWHGSGDWHQWEGAPVTNFPVVDQWMNENVPGKYEVCTEDKIKTRKDFDLMEPEERKAYTDAINCLRDQPSQLDNSVYPAAINRYMDYAVTHVNQTRTVHLSGFFLTWHRYFLHLFENDLRDTCGYQGAFPYWNWPATADNLTASAVFDGSEYSMSGDGEFTNDDPIVLAPTISIPHGSGGGCIKSGPFQGMNRVMDTISIDYLINGTEPPHSVYDLKESCLTRDLNEFAAKLWTNYTAVQGVVESPDQATFTILINGIVGGNLLGAHSGAHFVIGDPASNIFVSAMDPIWYPLHTMLDRVYTSWQIRHPDIADTLNGTMTANNAPPSAEVQLDTIEPDWGYFQRAQIQIGELISTTSGPFCYKYDSNI